MFAQHKTVINATINAEERIISVQQELTYTNTSADTLNHIILNDWSNAYSAKTTPMARRFTDEFVKAFHLAKDDERGSTTIGTFIDQNGRTLTWSRPDKHPDLVLVQLKNPIYPGRSFTIKFTYDVKIPIDRFTRFGYSERTGNYNLRDWYLSVARYENGFVQYSNENIDDIANAATDYTVTLNHIPGYAVYTDLDGGSKGNTYAFYAKNRIGFNLNLEKERVSEIFNFSPATIISSLRDNRVNDVERSLAADRVIKFTNEKLGTPPYQKIIISQVDYDRNPIYGLNQLPSFIRPFPDSFIYELKFLKTYVNAMLKTTLKLDPRKDSWVYNFMEMQLVVQYLNDNYPDMKLMGNLSYIKLLQGHNVFNINQNDQYLYVYLLMARKNLDQPLGNPKNTFIKFNEQIANKYKTAQGVKYLDDYTGNSAVAASVKEFFAQNINTTTQNRTDFENILQKNAGKDISWFFEHVIDTRELIDYKISGVKKSQDSVKVSLKNVTGTPVPVSLYGVKKKEVVFKQWVNAFSNDTTIVIPRNEADRLALNYRQELPEFNPRNNQRTLKSFWTNRRPYKFTFFQDLEDQNYNQVFYVPAFTYNLYDGLSPGLRLHNKSVLDKPFIFDVNALYSPNTQKLIGGAGIMFNHYIREGSLYNIRYSLSGNTYHYTPDARYFKFVPSVQLRMRSEVLRKNIKEFITFRQVMVDRRPSQYTELLDIDPDGQSYSVFDARYSYSNMDIRRTRSLNINTQVSNSFGKLSAEYQYRHLFNDNRQVNIRFFGGAFMYRDISSDFFSFGVDRAPDYLFDYNYYGRSESTGLFSQQLIMADGGFKSMLDTSYANQWMATVNTSFNVWNWIEIYGDAGLVKNKYNGAEFLYDSGVRLNLVTDYFELYFPVYSSLGFEPSMGNYSQRIRFVVTLSPGTLLSLFTRKWL